jgi:hypothetical protein
MEIAPIPFEVNGYRKRPMPCFIRGCQNHAENLAKFVYGSVVVQGCLCHGCLNKSEEFILQGLGVQPKISLVFATNLAEVKISFEDPHWETDSTEDRALLSQTPI